MSPFLPQTFLVADGYFSSPLGRRAGSPTALSAQQWCVLGAGVIAILVVFVLGSWQSRRAARPRARSRPRRLFWSLCQAHHLSWWERWTLWRIARHQRLANPARLFLEPHRFEAANLSAALRGQSPRIAAMRKRLFAMVDTAG